MSKVKIIHKHSEKSVLDEKEMLIKLKHPFLVNMICTFQDYDNLYILMDLLTGGDLRYHLNQKKKFSENEVKFFVSCILLGVEYIHENNIIHRDLKPENLVLDEKGYLRITDFGVAKKITDKKCFDNSGTPGYLAPEVHFSQGHTFTADFYAIGVICYELLLGNRPYIGSDRQKIKELMLNKEVFIEKSINNLSFECVEFVNGCLKHKESERLGYNHGINDLKKHHWFIDCDWEKLLNKELVASFIPQKGENYDKNYCESNDKVSNETLERYKLYMKRTNYEKIFENYTSFNNEFDYFNSVERETMARVNTNFSPNKYYLCNETIKNFVPITVNKKMNKYNNNSIILPKVFIKSHNISNNIATEMEKMALIKNIKLIRSHKFNMIGKNDNDNNINISIKNIENQNKSIDFENNNCDNKNVDLNCTVKNRNSNEIFNNINSISKNSHKKIISSSEVSYKNDIFPVLNSTSFNRNKKIFQKSNNIGSIDFHKFKRKKLSIHNFSADEKKEIKDVFQTTKENSTINNNKTPVRLPPLNKENKEYHLITTFRQFKFQLIDKKKIKFLNFRNKIVENNPTNSQKFLMPIKVMGETSKITNDEIVKNNDNKIMDVFIGKSQSSDYMGKFQKNKKLI